MKPISQPPTNQSSSTARKPYVTPKIEVVALRPSETVLGFCYTSSSAGPNQTFCRDASLNSCMNV